MHFCITFLVINLFQNCYETKDTKDKCINFKHNFFKISKIACDWRHFTVSQSPLPWMPHGFLYVLDKHVFFSLYYSNKTFLLLKKIQAIMIPVISTELICPSKFNFICFFFCYLLKELKQGFTLYSPVARFRLTLSILSRMKSRKQMQERKGQISKLSLCSFI